MHLEAAESYCNGGQYYIGRHSRCFDALRAYYAQDMQLFGLPSCQDESAGAAAATGAGMGGRRGLRALVWFGSCPRADRRRGDQFAGRWVDPVAVQ